MKILLISPTEKGIGGVAQHVNGLSKFLINNGHFIEIISSENTFTIPIKGLKNPSFMISSFLKTKFKKDYDIVHAHNTPSAFAMKNVVGKKVLTLHGIYSQQIDILHGKTIGKISGTVEEEALGWADVITVISKEAQDYYHKIGYKTHYIPNAIDLNSLPQGEKRLYDKQLIFAGRISKEKGILNLLTVAEKLPPDIHMIIVGSGNEEKKVKDAAKKLSNLHFLGYQPREETIKLIRGSDILIQPSLVEGTSTSLLEAMACKTVIIATEIGGNKEIIENDKTGLLVPPDSHEKILEQIINLYSDKDKFNNLAKNALVKVKEYDWTKVGIQYLQIYSNLL